MQESEAAPTPNHNKGGMMAVLGGIDLFATSVVIPIREAFSTTIERNKVAARIKKAMAPLVLGQDAAEIAARTAPSGHETKQSMDDLVTLSTNKATADLQRQITSLQGQLNARAPGGAGKGKKKKKGGKKPDFRSRSKTAGHNGASSKARAGAAGPGNAAGAGAKGKSGKDSDCKPAGKKRGSGTAKRS